MSDNFLIEPENLSNNTFSEDNNLLFSSNDVDLRRGIEDFWGYETYIYYISDLHLDYKIIDSFKSKIVSRELLISYFKKIINNLFKDYFSRNSQYHQSYIIFVGDVSFDFEIFKLFFSCYKEIKFFWGKTFFILGNHEFWDKSLIKRCGNIDAIIEEYRSFLKTKDIILLEKELYAAPHYSHNPLIFCEHEILTLTKEKFWELTKDCKIMIFGGVGFAGLNKQMNCNNGIYGDLPITEREEKAYSERMSKLHKKLRDLIPSGRSLIVATHMPKRDWTNSPHVSDWFYINGHTHKNKFVFNEKQKILADNQVGYHRQSFSIKRMPFNVIFNHFDNLGDGIYEITKNQYIDFYYNLGKIVTINKLLKKVYLVKKDGIYCFFAIDCNNHLKQLCGGYLRKTNGHNIEYYYSRMTNYTNSLHKFLGSYFSFQKRVSDEIKSIGGVGKIHGCIVDIDFFNHLFINPYDRRIIPYYAEDTSEQLVFENLISLLKMTHPVLETKTKARLMKNKQINSLLFLPTDKIKKPKKTTGNNIYGLSRLIYNLQVTNNFNIIRIWNDKLASTDSEETGRLIFEDLVIGLQNKNK